MIEVVLDFNEIEKIEDECINFDDKEIRLKCKHFTYIYIYKKLGIIDMIAVNWDAFSDNLTSILHKDIPEDYRYDPDNEWGWSDYDDYRNYLEWDRSMGPKNEKDFRDDMRLIFINLYDFNHKHHYVAQKLLDVLTTTYSDFIHHRYTRKDEILKFEICIKS